MPLTSFIPTLWVTALCVEIWWKDLLPVNGKSRSLLFYFARLLLVIYVVTLAVIVSFLFGGWVQAIAFVVFNLVGFLSVCLALLKKDIMRCWKQLWMCQTPDELVAEEHNVHDTENPPRRKRDFSIFYIDSLRKSVQSLRHIGSIDQGRSIPVNCDEDESNTRQAVVRFDDDTHENDI
jgi:hypothetical protein